MRPIRPIRCGVVVAITVGIGVPFMGTIVPSAVMTEPAGMTVPLEVVIPPAGMTTPLAVTMPPAGMTVPLGVVPPATMIGLPVRPVVPPGMITEVPPGRVSGGIGIGTPLLPGVVMMVPPVAGVL